jgi:uncharacterized protein
MRTAAWRRPIATVALLALTSTAGADEDKLTRLQRECDAPEGGRACWELGTAVENNDPARAGGLFRRACDLHHGDGCVQLGIMAETGRGQPLDPGRGNALYRLGCDQGAPWGCHHIGVNLRDGNGIDADPAAAQRYLRKGCDLKHADSCNNLGRMFELGKGVPRDFAAAATLYENACALEPGWGCNNLGVFLQNGSGRPKDMDRAILLYDKACHGGIGMACRNLAHIVDDIYLDRDAALQLLQLGCELGDTTESGNACTLLIQKRAEAKPKTP